MKKGAEQTKEHNKLGHIRAKSTIQAESKRGEGLKDQT